MKIHLQRLACPVLLGLCLQTAHAAAIEDHPGYLNLQQLAGIAGREPSVEVTLTGPVLKMLMQLPVEYDDDAAQAVELLKVVDHILVRVFPMDAERAEDMLTFINDTSAQLEAENWTRIVRVREENDSNVDIHVKLSDDGENLNGLAIMAFENGNGGNNRNDDEDDDDDGDGNDGEQEAEVVFVNIAGNFNPAYLANIGEQFDIGYLGEIDEDTISGASAP